MIIPFNFTLFMKQIVAKFASQANGDCVNEESVCVACLGILQQKYCQDSFCSEVQC